MRKDAEMRKTQQITTCEKEIKSTKQDCKKFISQIQFLDDRIEYAEKNIPRMQRELKNLIDSLPSWRENLQVNKTSLDTHIKRLVKKEEKLAKLIKKARLIREIQFLDKELKNADN